MEETAGNVVVVNIDLRPIAAAMVCAAICNIVVQVTNGRR